MKYKLVKRDGKVAIFDENNNQISKWWDNILESGLVNDESEYYLVHNNDCGDAIFHKDNPNKPISKWWEGILEYGLVKGKSDYYIVYNDFDDAAIFHKNNPNKPITKWWDEIYPEGLVNGESEYYIVADTSVNFAVFRASIFAIFHVSGIRVTDWYDDYNLVLAEMDKLKKLKTT